MCFMQKWESASLELAQIRGRIAMSKIVVVGGGAAGLLCAAKSAEKGNDVIIIVKNE